MKGFSRTKTADRQKSLYSSAPISAARLGDSRATRTRGSNIAADSTVASTIAGSGLVGGTQKCRAPALEHEADVKEKKRQEQAPKHTTMPNGSIRALGNRKGRRRDISMLTWYEVKRLLEKEAREAREQEEKRAQRALLHSSLSLVPSTMSRSTDDAASEVGGPEEGGEGAAPAAKAELRYLLRVRDGRRWPSPQFAPELRMCQVFLDGDELASAWEEAGASSTPTKAVGEMTVESNGRHSPLAPLDPNSPAAGPSPPPPPPPPPAPSFSIPTSFGVPMEPPGRAVPRIPHSAVSASRARDPRPRSARGGGGGLGQARPASPVPMTVPSIGGGLGQPAVAAAAVPGTHGPRGSMRLDSKKLRHSAARRPGEGEDAEARPGSRAGMVTMDLDIAAPPADTTWQSPTAPTGANPRLLTTTRLKKDVRGSSRGKDVPGDGERFHVSGEGYSTTPRGSQQHNITPRGSQQHITPREEVSCWEGPEASPAPPLPTSCHVEPAGADPDMVHPAVLQELEEKLSLQASGLDGWGARAQAVPFHGFDDPFDGISSTMRAAPV